MKYKIEEYPNPNRIGIHLSKKLTEKMIITFHAEKSALEETDFEGKLEDENLRFLAAALYQIDGINSVTVNPYEINIGKGECFDWKDMEAEILRTINVMIGPKEEMEELPRITMTDTERKKIQSQLNREMRDFNFFTNFNDDNDH